MPNHLKNQTFLFFITLFIIGLQSFGVIAQIFTNTPTQIPSEMWHDGEFDTENGETLKGRIKYDLKTENIQFVYGNILKSFSSDNIEAFQIIDATTNRVRNFYSLPFKKENNYSKKHFFELLYDGSTSLLTREKLVERFRNIGNPYSPFGSSTVRYISIEYDYFLIDEAGEITQLESTKPREVVQYFKNHREKLKEFIERNKLKLERNEDMIALVEYYCTLQ
jgi:hypothetical protein